jgi:hypothetical protein
MKAPDKHEELARGIVENWQDTHAFKIPVDIKHDMLIDLQTALRESHARGLAEGLAARIVGPSDEEIWFASNSQVDVSDAGEFRFGARWYRDNIKITSAQIRVPERMKFEELAEKVFPALKQLPHSQYAKGWNECIDEIQRLNGIKEKVE